MTPQEIIKLAATLIEIPSDPEHGELAVAEKINSILQSEGIDSWIDMSPEGRPNVLAVLEGEKEGKTLLLNGHTDVVPPGEGWTKNPWEASKENDRLYGRGASDMKGGIAAMMAAAIDLKRMDCPFNGRLVLLFNSDEERSNIGMKHYIKNPIPADYAIVGEPTGLIPCVGHRGNGRIRIYVSGEPGHCAVVQEADNALYKLARIITALEQHGEEVSNRISEVGNASLMVTMASGGTAPNTVPDEAWLEVDRRVLPGETKDSIVEEIRAWAEEASKEEVALDCYQYFPAFSISRNHTLVEVARGVSQKVIGKEVSPGLFTAGTEAPFFSVNLNCPTIILGPGDLATVHGPDEYVEVNQLIQGAKIYHDIAMKLLK